MVVIYIIYVLVCAAASIIKLGCSKKNARKRMMYLIEVVAEQYMGPSVSQRVAAILANRPHGIV